MWALAKSLQIPLDNKIKNIEDIPYTISYAIRKRIQIDSYNEFPSEKRPPTSMIWYGTPEDIEEWFDKVFDNKKQDSDVVYINESEIEQ